MAIRGILAWCAAFVFLLVPRTDAGGLQFVLGPAVRIASQENSTTQGFVHVKLMFKNSGKFDYTGMMEFPFPRINLADVIRKEITQISSSPTDNYLNFSVTVNGLEFPYERKARAWLGDKEITQELENLGLPFGAYSQALQRALLKKNLSSQHAQKLMDLGVLRDEGADHYIPLWSAQVIYQWQQTYSVAAPTVVEYQFQPLSESLR